MRPGLSVQLRFGIRMQAIAAFSIMVWSASHGSAQCTPLGWTEAGGGVNNTIHAMVEFDDGSGRAIVVGGEFTQVGGYLDAQRIAKWDGTNWFSLGDANDTIYALAVHDDGSGPALYAGGDFTMIGGVAANRIAKWNGKNWTPLGDGVNATVRAIIGKQETALGGPALFVGGAFVNAGGAPASRIARWSGNQWSVLSTGVNNPVHTLTTFNSGRGTELYAGGEFTLAGGGPAARIARWNGAAWNAVGSGSGFTVRTMASVQDGPLAGLYAAGHLQVTEGQTRNLARWDGVSWHALPNLTPVTPYFGNPVMAMTIHQGPEETALYVAASYGAVGPWEGGVIKLDGAKWVTLGGATSTGIRAHALLISDIQDQLRLFAGGVGSGPYTQTVFRMITKRTACLPETRTGMFRFSVTFFG